MLTYLESKGLSDPAMQGALKDFAILKYDEKQAAKKATLGICTFGKYRGKSFQAIAQLDKKYLEWLSKNKKYISLENQVVLDQILDATGGHS